MPSPIEKPANDRGGQIALLLAVPTFAFLLGRQTMTFSGTPSAWFTVTCLTISFAYALFQTIVTIRKVP